MHMEMLHFSSLEKRIGRSLVRFPVAYGFLFLLVLGLLAKAVAPSSYPDEYFSFLWVYSAVGFLIALAMDLLREKKVFGAWGWLAEVAALALWLVIWLTATRKGIGAAYTAVSVAVAAVVAGLTVPFLKDRDDERICLGACDILRKGFSKISDGVARWLFLPLLCVYLVTLYVYAFRILLQWKLPDGFTRCSYFNDHPVEVVSVSEKTFRMSLKESDGVYEFDFPIQGVNHPVTLTALEGRAIFYLRYINVDGKVLDDVAHNGSDARFKRGFVSGMLFY